MTDPKVSAEDGSTGIGGDVNAPVVNVRADNASTVTLTVEHQIDRELPSFLGAVIVVFSQQSLSEYGRGPRRVLSAEVLDKLQHNKFPQEHPLIKDFSQHVLVLEKAYHGVEQQNADARYLVRRKAGIAYQSEIAGACKGISPAQVLDYVRANLDGIIEKVVSRLLEDYKKSREIKVNEEHAHLAISLIVADAIVECEVLERP